LDVTLGTNDINSVAIHVEATNPFGTGSSSTSVKIGSDVANVAVRVGRPSGGSSLDVGNSRLHETTLVGSSGMSVGGLSFPGGFTPFDRSGDGTFVGQQEISWIPALFEVRARGNPMPQVDVYRVEPDFTTTRLAGSAWVMGASATQDGVVYLAAGIMLRDLLDKTVYRVVLQNPLGSPVTNTVTLAIYPAALAPTVVATAPVVPSVTPSIVGPIDVGTTGFELSIPSSYTYPVGSSFQWLRNGLPITGATNLTLTFGAFAVTNVVPYTVRIRTPLYGTGTGSSSAAGEAISASVTPFTSISANLSKTNLTGPLNAAGDFELTVTGSRTADISIEKETAPSVWTPDAVLIGGSQSTPTITGVAAVDDKRSTAAANYIQVNLDSTAGVYKFRVGSPLTQTMNGNYRVKIIQRPTFVTSPTPTGSGVDTRYFYFNVAITTAADLVLPTGPPSPALDGAGQWVSGSSTAMTIEAPAYSQVNLGAYVNSLGVPAPRFKWEKQTGANQFTLVSNFTNSQNLLLNAVPTNAGIYRITATNATGGAAGVSKLVTFTVNRVLDIDQNLLLYPSLSTDSVVDVPIELVGFGDESVLSFTLLVDSPYVQTSSANVALALSPALQSSTTLSYRTADATPSSTRLKMQVLVSKADPSKPFPSGTNRLLTLSLKSKPVQDIALARAATPPSPLLVPVQVLTGSAVASDFLPLRVALTNSTAAPLVAVNGSFQLVADSLEGDVNGSYTVTVADITEIANVLASGTIPTTLSTLALSRFDTAPIDNLGDGKVDLTDLVQVARYVARLDGLKPAGGPSSGFILNSSPFQPKSRSMAKSNTAAKARKVRLGWADWVAGQEVWVPVVLSGNGDENALAFNLEFNPEVLQYSGIRAPNGTSQMDNALAAGSGRVGVILWKGAGSTLPASEGLVAEVGFRVKSASGTAKIAFGNRPVDPQIATIDAQEVSAVQYQGGEWTIGPRRRVVGGRLISHQSSASGWNLELQTVDSSGQPVSAKGRSLRVQAADRLDALDAEWSPVGVTPEVTPAGTLRLPLPPISSQASRFLRIREE
jgi:hypothetical protein